MFFVDKLTIPEIAEKLEKGEISPKVLDVPRLGALVQHFRDKGYNDLKIEGILKAGKRSLQRYLERYRGDIRLELGEYFQQNEVAKAATNMERRMQRLERLLESGKLSVSEEVKVIMASEQIEKDRFAMLIATGYFNLENSREEVKIAYEKSVEERKLHDALGSKWAVASLFSPGQKQVLANYNNGTDYMSPHELFANRLKMDFIIETMIKETKQKMEEVLRRFRPRVAASSHLRCKLFVINELSNN